MQDTPQSQSGSQPPRNQPSRFVAHMHQLIGEDPDPLVLEEIWAYGLPAAIDNLHRRRSHRAEYQYNRQHPAVLELERIAALTPTVDSFLEDHSQPVNRRYAPAWPQCTDEKSTNVPYDSASNSQENHQAPSAFNMRAAHATQFLGVSAEATREEIRTAYRRMVIQCHPDRFPDATDAARRHATQQLAEVNEAYRILCEDLLNQAA
jgi:hypothetical protein